MFCLLHAGAAAPPPALNRQSPCRLRNVAQARPLVAGEPSRSRLPGPKTAELSSSLLQHPSLGDIAGQSAPSADTTTAPVDKSIPRPQPGKSRTRSCDSNSTDTTPRPAHRRRGCATDYPLFVEPDCHRSIEHALSVRAPPCDQPSPSTGEHTVHAGVRSPQRQILLLPLACALLKHACALSRPLDRPTQKHTETNPLPFT